MKIPKIFKLKLVFVAVAIVIMTAASQTALAYNFDITGTGWCLKNHTLSGGFVHVEIKQDNGTGCTETASFTAPIKIVNCQYQYSCGSCVGGTMTCNAPTYIPSNYPCDNSPLTTQSCPLVDSSSPTVAISVPVNSANVKGTVPITFSASDDSGVTDIEIHVDGVEVGTVIPSSGSSSYYYNWVTNPTGGAGVSDGSHTITVKAYDAANNQGSDSRTVTVDNTAPAASIQYPASGDVLNGTIIVSAIATDSIGIHKVGFSVDDGPITYDTSYPYTYEWNTVSMSDGNYTLKVKAYDLAGNASTQFSTTVTVNNVADADTVLPAVSITYPTNAASTVDGTITVTASASDNIGVTLVELYVDSDLIAPSNDSVSPYDFSWDTTASANGSHTIYVKAYDAAGNIATASMAVTVNNTAATPTSGTLVVKKVVFNTGGGTKQAKDFSFLVNGGTTTANVAAAAIAFESDGDNSLTKTPGTYTITEPAYANYSTSYNNCSSITVTAGQTTTCTITNTYNIPKEVPVACSYTYDCGKCSVQGKTQCAVVSVVPKGAICSNKPVTTQSCAYAPDAVEPCKSYTYTEWGDCDASGKQLRKVVASLPAGCQGGLQPYLEQKCVPSCVYTFSAWGSCVSGTQKRIILSKSPQECLDETESQILEQNCKTAGAGEVTARPSDAPLPEPDSVMARVALEPTGNFNGRTSSEWQAYYFGVGDCGDAVTCGGEADPDNDGLTNNDEFRYGTDPKFADTDRDGYVDGHDILEGRNPLVAGDESGVDKVVFEDPRVEGTGTTDKELLTIEDWLDPGDEMETVAREDGTKVLKLSGKALPNTFVNIYVYSDPVVMTVKADADGNWMYILDKPLEEGNHVAYVTANDNAGKVVAKGSPLAFIQTAEAATVLPGITATEDKAPSPVRSRMAENYFIFGFIALAGLLLTVFVISIVRKEQAQKTGDN